jgi:hypothetical protein
MPDNKSAISAARQRLLVELANRHIQAELAKDIEGTLATLCADPHYEIHPLGLVITHRDAIAEFYRRTVFMFARIRPSGPSGTFESGSTGKFVGDDGIVVHDHGIFIGDDGIEIPLKALSIFAFDEASGLLKGEQIFLNRGGATVFSNALGTDFSKLPGVSTGG